MSTTISKLRDAQSTPIDGTNPTTIVPAGVTHTPKQIQLDKANGKLYWSDREGMRVMRVNLDGSDLEASIFGICAATEDKKEGPTAFLEKRAAQCQGR